MLNKCDFRAERKQFHVAFEFNNLRKPSKRTLRKKRKWQCTLSFIYPNVPGSCFMVVVPLTLNFRIFDIIRIIFVLNNKSKVAIT